MRILLCTHRFSPDLGGIETMSLLLARAFVARGHEVRVITASPSRSPADDHGLRVLRRPSFAALWGATAWCDVCFHNHISLGFAGPALLLSRPWVVATQTWIPRDGWSQRAKRLLLRRARSVAISRAIADSLPVRSVVIPNCYDTDTFREPDAAAPAPAREGLIFVGRLVSDKGADLALHALARLAAEGLRPRLTLVGDGPERPALETLVRELGLAGQARFTGALTGSALAAEFSRHRVQLVPSRWAEPFGIVALEGAACGCVVVGSSAGGLADAIGPCGYTFPNGDAAALAALVSALLRGAAPTPDPAARRAHIARHSLDAVAGAYLRLLSPPIP